MSGSSLAYSAICLSPPGAVFRYGTVAQITASAVLIGHRAIGVTIGMCLYANDEIALFVRVMPTMSVRQ